MYKDEAQEILEESIEEKRRESLKINNTTGSYNSKTRLSEMRRNPSGLLNGNDFDTIPEED
jgi:hypothetical protein